MSDVYAYALSLTSQFYFCSLPLRLDSYSSCGFGCDYCFSLVRGGQRPAPGVQEADVEALDRRLVRVRDGMERSAVDEFLAMRQAVHMGGMTDPFPPIETRRGVTRRCLEVLAARDQPAVISTKGTLVAEAPYRDLLASGPFMVQFSFSTLDPDLARLVEAGVAPPAKRLEAAAELSDLGVPVACRLQPVLPTREHEVDALIERCASTGARHLAIEHLKLPVESSWHIDRLSCSLNLDVTDHYKQRGAIRQGREWLLPVAERLPRILKWRKAVRQCGMTFGAADTDLLHLSDGRACCSGADLHLPEAFYFSHNYLTAVRAGQPSGFVRASSLRSEWRPERSVARFIHSDSRLPSSRGGGAALSDYIDRSWNGRPNGNSPAMFWGVTATGRRDGAGHDIYSIELRVQREMGFATPSIPGAP